MSPKPTIQLHRTEHDGTSVIQLIFTCNFKLKETVKSLPEARWSVAIQCWFIPEQEFDPAIALVALKPLAIVDADVILRNQKNNALPIGKAKRNSFQGTDLKKHSINTIKVSCDEEEQTYYLSLSFALKEQLNKLEGAKQFYFVY